MITSTRWNVVASLVGIAFLLPIFGSCSTPPPADADGEPNTSCGCSAPLIRSAATHC